MVTTAQSSKLSSNNFGDSRTRSGGGAVSTVLSRRRATFRTKKCRAVHRAPSGWTEFAHRCEILSACQTVAVFRKLSTCPASRCGTGVFEAGLFFCRHLRSCSSLSSSTHNRFLMAKMSSLMLRTPESRRTFSCKAERLHMHVHKRRRRRAIFVRISCSCSSIKNYASGFFLPTIIFPMRPNIFCAHAYSGI